MLQSTLRSPIFRFGPADLCSSPHPTPALERLGEKKEARPLQPLDECGRVVSSGGDEPVSSEGR